MPTGPGLGGQELQPGNSKLHLSLSTSAAHLGPTPPSPDRGDVPGTMDANLKDLFLIGRLIKDAVDGSVVVGVSGPLTITIRPSFTVKLGWCTVAGSLPRKVNLIKLTVRGEHSRIRMHACVGGVEALDMVEEEHASYL